MSILSGNLACVERELSDMSGERGEGGNGGGGQEVLGWRGKGAGEGEEGRT